jgi:hypothetical protein
VRLPLPVWHGLGNDMQGSYELAVSVGEHRFQFTGKPTVGVVFIEHTTGACRLWGLWVARNTAWVPILSEGSAKNSAFLDGALPYAVCSPAHLIVPSART